MFLLRDLQGSRTLKASFYKGLCNGCAYTDHFRTRIMEQIPSDGHTLLLLWNYPEHQPGCEEGSNLSLRAWQVLFVWRTRTRPNKLPTRYCSWSQAPRLCGSSLSCSSKTDSSLVKMNNFHSVLGNRCSFPCFKILFWVIATVMKSWRASRTPAVLCTYTEIVPMSTAYDFCR